MRHEDKIETINVNQIKMKAKRGKPRKLNKTNMKNHVKQDVSTTNNITTEKQKFNSIQK